MTRDDLLARAAAVTEARAYTVEHFGRDRGSKHVGRMPAADFDLAVEALAAAVPELLRRLDLAEQALVAIANAADVADEYERSDEYDIEGLLALDCGDLRAARAALTSIRAPLDQPQETPWTSRTSTGRRSSNSKAASWSS